MSCVRIAPIAFEFRNIFTKHVESDYHRGRQQADGPLGEKHAAHIDIAGCMYPYCKQIRGWALDILASMRKTSGRGPGNCVSIYLPWPELWVSV